ncbi:MAG TPA: PhzF family phenazine biosynthesis protein [Mycobacteriales bacterium]|nr:PhzF family phenazine biosynthesis protein [Mycobacteriales bacterium]
MGWLPYEVVDVFTDRPFAGNPLAVVLGTEALATEELQALAAEFNLSETAFPQEVSGEGYRLRIFTPTVELPFAGHPSVGAASVLRRLGRVRAGRLVQRCGAGDLPLEVPAEGPVVLTAGTPSAGPVVDPGPLLDAVGLVADDLDETAGDAGRAGCGIDFTYLLVRPDAVARAVPDLRALAALDLGTGLSLTAWDGAAAHSRVFVPEVGVAEDPATGSAAVGLGVHLAARGLLREGRTEYVVRQGEEVGRPSTMRCAVEARGGAAERVTVAGDAVLVARGEVRRPG